VILVVMHFRRCGFRSSNPPMNGGLIDAYYFGNLTLRLAIQPHVPGKRLLVPDQFSPDRLV
jgi:hypothetical protein